MPTDKRIPAWINQLVPRVDSHGVDSPDEKPFRYPEFIALLAQYKRAVYQAMYPMDTVMDSQQYGGTIPG